MSGGVDSSVAAHLMLQSGYDVTGVTLKLTCDILTRDGFIEDSSCCSVDDIRKARENCDRFAIPHHVLNFSAGFNERIVKDFAREYFAGRTPNPCILCNREMKWTDLLSWMDEQGLEILATGHYARLQRNDQTGRIELLKARDPEKDQSYVLWALSQEQLARTCFPLGDLTKTEVRALAADLRLANAEKPDSQDICFVPDNNYRTFLEAYDGDRSRSIGPGNFVDAGGNVVGRHEGYYRYTVGQRRGLRLALGHPVYVKRIDPERNEVMVVPAGDLGNAGCLLSSVNWISMDAPDGATGALVKIRYRHRGHAAQLIPLNSGKIVVNFEDAAESVTPGQSAVFYDGDRVLGGGIIETALDNPEDVERCLKSQ